MTRDASMAVTMHCNLYNIIIFAMRGTNGLKSWLVSCIYGYNFLFYIDVESISRLSVKT